MFKNNLKIAWRNLLNDRQFAFLNLTGLATGLACTFLIYLWVSDELNVDQFHRNGGRLYEVMQNIPLADGSPLTIDNTPDPLARALAEQMPEVKETVVVKAPDADGSLTGIISANGNTSVKGSELYVTQNFLNIFSFPLIRGNKQQLFTNTRSVLLSSATAIKLFHTTQNIIGKTITWDRGTGHMGKLNGPYVISGIFETPPSNSSMQFDLLFENAIYQNIQRDQGWLSSNQTTYLLLKPGADAQKLNGKLKNFITSKYKPGTDEYKWAGTLFIQRYTEKYLHNHYENGAPAGGRIEYVKLFSIIAIFILVIACINFMIFPPQRLRAE